MEATPLIIEFITFFVLYNIVMSILRKIQTDADELVRQKIDESVINYLESKLQDVDHTSEETQLTFVIAALSEELKNQKKINKELSKNLLDIKQDLITQSLKLDVEEKNKK